jgi:hypothetical protein
MIAGLKSQNAIVERMGTGRGIWQNKWVERAALWQFKRVQARLDRRD